MNSSSFSTIKKKNQNDLKRVFNGFFLFFVFVFFLFFFLDKHVLYINKCFTIECFVRKCITGEVPYSSFLQTAIVNRGKSCKLTLKKNSRLASMSRFILVSEIFQNAKFYDGIFNLFFCK